MVHLPAARDPSAFDALDFVFSDRVASNVIRRVITHRGQVWTCGEGGFEVWCMTRERRGLKQRRASSFFPFRRAAGGVINIGTGSPMSVCRADNSVWWVRSRMALFTARTATNPAACLDARHRGHHRPLHGEPVGHDPSVSRALVLLPD